MQQEQTPEREIQTSVQLLTDEELREQVLRGVTRKTTWRLRKKRRNPLPYLRIGGRIYYELAAVERWILANRVVT